MCRSRPSKGFDPQVEYTLRGVKENGQPDVGMYLKLDLPDFLLKSSRPEFEAYAKKEIAQAAAPFIEALKVNYKDVFTRFNPHAHLKALLEPQPVPEMAKTFALVLKLKKVLEFIMAMCASSAVSGHLLRLPRPRSSRDSCLRKL